MAGSKKSKVRFFSDGVHPGLRNIGKLKGFIELLFKNENKKLDAVNYIFCTDEVLLAINSKYLNHSYYTDIITFDLSGVDTGIRGEVYISLDRVKENARKFGNSKTEELHRVIFHGALHLCGYKDKTPQQIVRIRKQEDLLLSRYFKKRMFHGKQNVSREKPN